MTFQKKADIHSFSGPNWGNDYDSLCSNYSDEQCDEYSDMFYSEGQSVQSEQHEAQNALVRQFQEFQPLNKWRKGKIQTKLIPL